MIARRALPATIAAAAVALTAAVPALAKHGADDPSGDARGGSARSEHTATGSCSASSTAKLKSKHDDGRLETELEVDANRTGVRWMVTIRRNGGVAVRTHATTRGPSGSFSLERRIRDGAGTDRITARATSPSGEVCTARLSV